MDIKFRTYQILPQLKRYIHKIWVFESGEPMPDDDMKLVVPNGRLLLVMPFRNGIVGKMDEKLNLIKSNKIALIGMSDRPSVVDAEIYGPIGSEKLPGDDFKSDFFLQPKKLLRLLSRRISLYKEFQEIYRFCPIQNSKAEKRIWQNFLPGLTLPIFTTESE